MDVSFDIKEDYLISEMKNYSKDTRPSDVITFFPQINFDLTSLAFEYTKKLKKDNHRLLKNYIDIDFYDFEFVTLLTRNEQVVGFCTGNHRKNIYPEKSIRLLNRFYQDKDSNRVSFTREFLRPTTNAVINQQLYFSKILGYEYAFISREPRDVRRFTRFVEALDKKTQYDWYYKKGPFLVAPDPENITCWQSIGVTSLQNKNLEPFWSYW